MWRDLNTFEGLWEITRKEGDFKNNSEGIDGAWALKEKNNDISNEQMYEPQTGGHKW